MIAVKNLKKSFKKLDEKRHLVEFFADNDISFEAKSGEVLGILGPNGAGKTTLLRSIAGIMVPTSGTIEIDGMNYETNAEAIKKKIAFLSGNTHLYKNLSPYELLEMCAEFYDIPSDKIKSHIDRAVADFNLHDFLYQRIENLSTGQQQRVGLARCVVHDPSYYILDEATSGLDIISSQDVLNFIKREKERNKCIIYSTHYMEEAENICDRIVMINKGVVVATGTPDEIRSSTKTTNLRDAFFAVLGA